MRYLHHVRTHVIAARRIQTILGPVKIYDTVPYLYLLVVNITISAILMFTSIPLYIPHWLFISLDVSDHNH